MNIAISHVLVWVTIETVHQGSLEFVLNDADKRNNREHGWYTDRLQDMVHEALKPYDDIGLHEYQNYGDVSLCISVPCWSEWERIAPVVEQAVLQWKAKYRIDQMKVSL